MPAHSVDPRIDESREQPAVEDHAHDDAREEGHGELDLAHQALKGLTARAYPVGSPGVGVVRTSAPSCPQAGGERAAVATRPFVPCMIGLRMPSSMGGGSRSSSA